MSQGSSLGSLDESKHSESGERRRGHGRATVFETVGGGGGIADNSEEKNYEMVQPSFSRQQSTSSDDVEMARGRGLRRRRSHQRDEEKNNLSLVSVHTPLFRVPPRPEEPDPPRDANDQAPWPGSEFEVAKVLPDSVYLWACGEGGDQVPREKPVSTAGCLAAWVVLITQAMCYAGLWYVSGNRPKSDPEQSEDGADYSILAIAGAMYLLLSIAAADLWGGLALCLEGGDLGGGWFWRRKLFGVCLLGTFVTLIGASIRVLFYSSFENVDLVLGAAAVLFIADVDEKAMVLLKTVSDRWRLFWVLEVIGLSFWLAVVGIALTGNAGSVVNKDRNNDDYFCWLNGCEVLYSWYFVIDLFPIALTVCALLATSIFSTPRSPFLARRVVFGFFLLILFWVVMGILFYLLFIGIEAGLGLEAVFGVAALPLACCYRTELYTQLSEGNGRGRTEVVRHTRKWVLLIWVLLFMSVFIFDSIQVINSWHHADFEFSLASPTVSTVFEVLHSFLYLTEDMLLISGMLNAGMRPAGDRTPRKRWMLLGWFIGEGCNAMFFALFLALNHIFTDYLGVFSGSQWNMPLVVILDLFFPLCWRLMVGVFLWGEEAGTYGVAFWIAATMIRNSVMSCAQIWTMASIDGTVT